MPYLVVRKQQFILIVTLITYKILRFKNKSDSQWDIFVDFMLNSICQVTLCRHLA